MLLLEYCGYSPEIFVTLESGEAFLKPVEKRHRALVVFVIFSFHYLPGTRNARRRRAQRALVVAMEASTILPGFISFQRPGFSLITWY